MLAASGFAHGRRREPRHRPVRAGRARLTRGIVAELSSFQLEHARELHADVAVLLNLAPDHLDRHGTLERYGAAKARLAELQRARTPGWSRTATTPGRARSAQRAPAQVVRVLDPERRRNRARTSTATTLVLAPRRRSPRCASRSTALSDASRRPVDERARGRAAADLAGATRVAIRAVLARFEGLPHRVRDVCVRARRALRRRLQGDQSRGRGREPARADRADRLARGRAQQGARVRRARRRRAPRARARARSCTASPRASSSARSRTPCPVERVATLPEAVARAAALAQPGDVVLLAPACASFDQFTSFEERGQRFAELARALPEGAAC